MSRLFNALQNSSIRKDRGGEERQVPDFGSLAVGASILQTDGMLVQQDSFDTGRVGTVSIDISDPAIFSFAQDGGPISEEYRIIRTKLVQTLKRPAIVMITSPAPGDGKTVTTLNLARSFAIQNDANLLVVDGDLVRGSLSRKLGIPKTPGLADILSDASELETSLVRVKQLENVFVLPAGDAGSKRTELLDSNHWKSLCKTFRQNFPITFLDAPPIASVADYDVLQDSCDAIVMVVRPDHTNRDLYRHCLEALPKEKFLGVILNAADPSTMSGGYGAYGYGHTYGAEPKKR